MRRKEKGGGNKPFTDFVNKVIEVIQWDLIAIIVFIRIASRVSFMVVILVVFMKIVIVFRVERESSKWKIVIGRGRRY